MSRVRVINVNSSFSFSPIIIDYWSVYCFSDFIHYVHKDRHVDIQTDVQHNQNCVKFYATKVSSIILTMKSVKKAKQIICQRSHDTV